MPYSYSHAAFNVPCSGTFAGGGQQKSFANMRKTDTPKQIVSPQEPKYATIGGEHWQIIFAEKIIDATDGCYCDGLCCWDDRTIYLKQSLSKEDLVRVAIHEAKHCVEGRATIFDERFVDRCDEAEVSVLKALGII